MTDYASPLNGRAGYGCEAARAAAADRVRQRDGEASSASLVAEIEALYRERYAGFRRALAVLSGSYEAAHDVVQEAFARALTQSHRYRGEGPLGAWVWAIAVRVALDQRRKSTLLPLDDVLDLAVAEPTYDPELAAAMRALPERRRLVFFLRYVADLSYEEIAAVCEISEGTVAATLAQARAALVKSLSAPASAEIGS